jgi:serine O-acetyltransferase
MRRAGPAAASGIEEDEVVNTPTDSQQIAGRLSLARPTFAVRARRRPCLFVDAEKCYAIHFRQRPTLVRMLWIWTWYFDLHCIAVYRLGQFAFHLFDRSKMLGLGPVLVYGVLQYLARLLHKVEISRYARIGPGFYIGHPATIFIGPTVIGDNCSVGHNVTIGVGVGGQRPGVPIIGNRVWIGPGATLTGGITIGDDATIGAGAVLSRDVPDGALVLGNPARVVLAAYDNRAVLGYPLPNDAEVAELE